MNKKLLIGGAVVVALLGTCTMKVVSGFSEAKAATEPVLEAALRDFGAGWDVEALAPYAHPVLMAELRRGRGGGNGLGDTLRTQVGPLGSLDRVSCNSFSREVTPEGDVSLAECAASGEGAQGPFALDAVLRWDEERWSVYGLALRHASPGVSVSSDLEP